MTGYVKSSLALAVLMILVPVVLFGQQRTGNIVEYFGKEKVKDLHEGKVVHVFKKGLALNIPSFGFESSSFPVDPVFDKTLMNPKFRASEGQVFDVDFLGNEMKWTRIEVDSTNSFSGRELRSAYVYLSYNSSSEKVVLFEASGHSLVTINGFPHEGDHYDFGWSLIPIKLKKGTNVFVLKVGRFSRIRARLLQANTPVGFTVRDLTMPDLLMEENKEYKGAVRVINATDDWVRNYTIGARLGTATLETKVMDIPPLSVYKIPFSIPSTVLDTSQPKTDLSLQLKSGSKKVVSTTKISLALKSKYKHHKNTFISGVDGSVQYYSVAPATTKGKDSLALFLSVHGASVEAVNQANAYKQKDWGNLVAPTNRRPYGFAWEDWGRLDALEVLEDAKNIFHPDESRIYLTGHSMGGHGTWYLGATYPDKFAAIAPCSGYPDLLLYRQGFQKRMLEMSPEQLQRFGISAKTLERMKREPLPTPVEKMITRAGTPSRTLKLIRNYLHYGVYVLHGEKDNVVPTDIARDMRKRLGEFHPDFAYYEYPGGAHWYGNQSEDWKPIFDFFKLHTLPKAKDINKLEFSTGSPGVSATSHFITIQQQEKPFDISSFSFAKDDAGKLSVTTKNVALLEMDFSSLEAGIKSIGLDGKQIALPTHGKTYFKKSGDEWKIVPAPSLKEKGPHRDGGFKDAFRNNVVFVYATKGSKTENDWYFNKARFDAETFWYRANGNISLVADVDFSSKKYPDRNVILYGNKSNNAAWGKLLQESPVQVTNNQVNFGDTTLMGNQWGMYFIVPRLDSDSASVGVVTATGIEGMKAAYANNYLVNGTTFPDFMLFDNMVLTNGTAAVKCAGFFGNDWSIEKGDFEWK